jgi:hypothetical protein
MACAEALPGRATKQKKMTAVATPLSGLSADIRDITLSL